MKRIIITLNQVQDTNLISELETYLRQVGGALQSGNKLIIQVEQSSEEWRPGKYLYRFMKFGLIAKIELLENVSHYIELPLSFIKTTIKDEDGNDVQVERSDIQFHKNKTSCLVRITDDSFSELYPLIAFNVQSIPTNLFCNDKYLLKLSEYAQPQNIE